MKSKQKNYSILSEKNLAAAAKAVVDYFGVQLYRRIEYSYQKIISCANKCVKIIKKACRKFMIMVMDQMFPHLVNLKK